MSNVQHGVFGARLAAVEAGHRVVVSRRNQRIEPGNGVFWRYRDPILTADHVPLTWRYDFDPATNPGFAERLGINAVFNAGAIKIGRRYSVVCRVEGTDRKSFFAVADSEDGIHFAFRAEPIDLSPADDAETNVYDMRLTAHEDGWIYGLYCAERKDPEAPMGDTVTAQARCGIARTRDLETWQRLPDLATRSSHQRNVVLHPEFVSGRYLLYTRPQDGFIDAGRGGGICTAFTSTMEGATIVEEQLLDARTYHTVKEAKNGAGAPPLKTKAGWLHIAHGVRNTAAGLRYVLYAFLCDPNDPRHVIGAPGGYWLAPQDDERVGDVSNVAFSNGAIVDDDGRVLVYYASSDTRLHVAETSVERLVDYVLHTPHDGLTSAASVRTRLALIRRNAAYLGRTP